MSLLIVICSEDGYHQKEPDTESQAASMKTTEGM